MIIFDFFSLIVILGALAAEAVFYPGFWQAKAHISIETILTLYAAYLAIFVITKKQNPQRRSWTLKVIAIILFIFSSILYFFEYRYFPNYSFSHFHLNPLGLAFAFSILAIFIYRPTVKKSILLTFSTYLLIVFALANLPAVIGDSVSGLTYAISTRNQTYNQKLAQEIGPDYDYFQFVNSIVKEDETIMLPPWQLPWRHTGDFNYARYFLYPRKVVNGQLTLLPSETNYVLLTSETENGMDKDYPIWPNFPVKAEEIIIYNFNDNTSQIITKNYDPKDWLGKHPWGLIKIK